MDHDKLAKANNQRDANFAADNKDFTVWWHKHLHCDPDQKWAVAARVAHKCKCYRDEFLAAKEVGAA